VSNDELKRLLKGFRPLDEIMPARSLDGLIGAPALDESPTVGISLVGLSLAETRSRAMA